MSEVEQKTKKMAWLNSIGTRFIIICVLILLLNIPLSMVSGVTKSRVYLFNDTMDEISSDWGGKQTIIAPIMNIPVKYTYEDKVYNEQKKIYEKIINSYETTYNILPETLNIDANIMPQIRHRGIFDVLVHTTKVNINGSFNNEDMPKLEGNYEILWEKASLSIGINSSLIRGDMTVFLDDKNNLSLNPGSGIEGINGISANVDLSKNKLNQKFLISLQFNGSSEVSFAPLGKRNKFKVTSDWPHPIFKDTFRPDNPTITEEGFSAEWDIPYIARDYPQVITNSSEINNMKYKLASVGLFDTMPIYKKAQRLSDYGIMFITLTFVMMFLFERKLKQRIHYVQYIIVGLAVSLFFLTVMSFSEYLSFIFAYTIASLIVIMMISLYIYAALKNKKTAISSGLIMVFLYSILYLMLSEADYALLIGTFILLTTIGAIMWETRNINQTVE